MAIIKFSARDALLSQKLWESKNRLLIDLFFRYKINTGTILQMTMKVIVYKLSPYSQFVACIFCYLPLPDIIRNDLKCKYIGKTFKINGFYLLTQFLQMAN
jgi:hypothetical protein